MHILGESADEGFVALDIAFEFFNASRFHRKADSVKHKPSGLLGNVDCPVKLVGADTVPAVGDQPDSDKPFVEADGRSFKDSSEFDRELLFASFTFPDIASGKERGLGAFTSGAYGNTVRPPKRSDEIDEFGFVRKTDDSLLQGLG